MSALDPSRFIVPGGHAVMLTPTVVAFLCRHTNAEIVAQQIQGRNPEIDAAMVAMRRVERAFGRPQPDQKRADPADREAQSGTCSTRQAAARLGVTERAVRRWCTTGQLPATQIDGRWRIPTHQLKRP